MCFMYGIFSFESIVCPSLCLYYGHKHTRHTWIQSNPIIFGVSLLFFFCYLLFLLLFERVTTKYEPKMYNNIYSTIICLKNNVNFFFICFLCLNLIFFFWVGERVEVARVWARTFKQMYIQCLGSISESGSRWKTFFFWHFLVINVDSGVA